MDFSVVRAALQVFGHGLKIMAFFAQANNVFLGYGMSSAFWERKLLGQFYTALIFSIGSALLLAAGVMNLPGVKGEPAS